MQKDGETVLWSWLHLSDIHFLHGGAAYRADQEFVLSRLKRDLVTYAMPGSLTPQAIIVTGDIATTGALRDTAEYDAAATFLEEIRAAIGPSTEMLLVPGNHDVQRTTDLASEAGKLVTGLRSKRGFGRVDESALNTARGPLLADRFANYTAFAQRVHAVDSDPLFWHHVVTATPDQKVHVLGINSALLANDDKDLHKLGVLRSRMDNVLARIGEDELVLLLSHHPFSWMSPPDAKHLETRAGTDIDVHLHGHLHEASNFGVRYGTGLGWVTVAAGAVHGDEPRDGVQTAHRYSIAALVMKEDSSVGLRIHMRKWIGRWVRDTDNELREDFAYLPVRDAKAPIVPAKTQETQKSTKAARDPLDGAALLAPGSPEWRVPVNGTGGPALCPAADAASRHRELMSLEATLLAQQSGTTLLIASVDHLGTSTLPWPSSFELAPDDVVIGIAEAGAHDAVAVVSSQAGTRVVFLERDTGRVDTGRQLDARSATWAVIAEGRVLLATRDGAVATCPAFTGIVDVERLEAAARGGSMIVQASGTDRKGERVTSLVLSSSRWDDFALLRRRDGIGAIGVDLTAAEPVVVGEPAVRTWIRKKTDSRVARFDKWLTL